MATKHVYAENTFTTTFQDLADGGTVTVQRDAYVVIDNDAGFNLRPANWTVQIDGMVHSKFTAMGFNSDLSGDPVRNSKLTVGSEGTIQVSDATSAAVALGIPVDVNNSGVIDGGAFGISAFVQGPTTSKGFTINNRASGEISGNFAIISDTSEQRITVNNQGTITGTAAAVGWDGDATIINTGTMNGDLRALDLDAVFSSSITNSGTILGDVVLSDGADTVRNTGLMAVSVLAFSDGKNSLTNSGTLSDVNFGSGDDTASNSGSTGSLHLGNGNNVLTNSGVIHNSVGFGDGNDRFSNSKLVEGAVSLGNGNNTMTNSGTIGQDLTGGSGNDVINSTGAVGQTIDAGAGDDIVSTGAHSETVKEGAGNDRYSLGGGDDRLIVVGSGFDTFDGGAGRDVFDGALTSNSFLINLGSKAVTINTQELAAGSAFTLLGNGGAIRGFESVIGGQFRDFIVGGSGADTIDGGKGGDLIAGGLGADMLTGGEGNDAFIYFQTQDSGVARATRDTIDDFEGSGSVTADSFDLGRIDANTKLTGDQAFSWIGGNTPFNHIAGELRMVTEGADTILQGDTNGDGRADFSIAVVGTQNFNETDFVL